MVCLSKVSSVDSKKKKQKQKQKQKKNILTYICDYKLFQKITK